VAAVIKGRYPNLAVKGASYPPSEFNSMAATVAGYTQMGLIAGVFFGTNIFGFLGMQEPQFYAWIKERKMLTVLALFFIGNQISAACLSTGAFEITYNGQLIWSKLESGTLPADGELLRLLRKQIRQETKDPDE